MLNYFLENGKIKQVKEICQSLNTLKKRIEKEDYIDSFKEFEEIGQKFVELKEIAVKNCDEKLANSQYVFKEYFSFFCHLGQYFSMIKNKEYRSSWNKLQDCLDTAKFIGRFAEISNRFELPPVIELLVAYEKLYPFTVFSSSEYVISKSHCSICGRSMHDFECSHIRGNLYWGEQAVEIIERIDEIQAVCIVRHPEDKRCILEAKDDSVTDEIKFKKLDLFMSLKRPLLQKFEIEEVIERRRDLNVKEVGRNEMCSCGSGKKFKRCCYEKMYYEHQRNIVTTLDTVSFYYF